MRRKPCGERLHEAYKRFPMIWQSLDYKGVMVLEDEETFDLELRNCHCGSTLAIEIPKNK